ncbi:MAG: phage tail sheath subtilisin-like domain-containing protein [Gammaproteobacteria bacterium]|nr:phage tail sheath subtilisin-like domain-containing protein [Gammaproteobacteria bacterium]
MPEYLAPGVYVEETSFRGKSIEGVSTSTTAFTGPTRKGPTSGEPVLITSFGDFERIFGGFENLDFGAGEVPNYVAHGVRNYFDNGGARLFMVRVYSASGGDGIARSAFAGGDADDNNNIRFIARSPGRSGNGTLTVSLSQTPVTAMSLDRAPFGTLMDDGGTVFIRTEAGFVDGSDNAFGGAGSLGGDENFISASVLVSDADGNEMFYENLGLAAGHPRYIGDILSPNPDRLVDQLELPFALELGDGVDAFRLHGILDGIDGTAQTLAGGGDGGEPAAGDYTDSLMELGRVDDISIVAAPGYASFADREGIQGALIGHAETRKAYRFAVLDARQGILPTEALTDKSVVDSSYAAMYYPWIVVSNPLARPDDVSIPREITLPPSGFICGIYARNDIARSVAKSPGNEVVRGALRFERNISHAEQELLNPRGVNCLRFFSGRGYRLWGSRTASSDPEWKYIGPRRYFLFLEHSIDRSTQWAVFENNGPELWANVREAVTSFLYNEWRSGNLLGNTPEEAFFVRCDRSTMTQNDLDNGRLICLIGVAVLKPAEFVIFRIGQKTAEARG